MKRRKFIDSLILTTGGLMILPKCKSPEQGKNSLTSSSNSGTITEPSRVIEILEETDVLVVGGGPSGVTAAISASRAGARTTIVERYNHLGGLWTGGLVLPLLSTHGLNKSKQQEKVIHGIPDEIAQRLKDMGMAIHDVDPVIDPEATKYVLEKMVQEAGIHMLYHCWMSNIVMEDKNIKAVIIESKSGRKAIVPKVVIDCTGDGDVFHLAGEGFEEMKYHIGLVSRLGNIDRIDKTKPGFEEIYVGDPTPLKSVNWFNMHGENDQDGTDLHTLSKLQQQYRIDIWENTEHIRSIPGHEEVFLLDTASQLGVRVSRILDGKYKLTLEDSMTYKSFDDVIGVCGAWTSLLYNTNRIQRNERPLWQIPYRSLVPKHTKNLLVAGRCFSFDKPLVEDARIIGTALLTGHGAGAAAAVAVKSYCAVQDTDVQKIQKVLKDQKAYLG
ncbi:MAG: FAD-dependent oxidoreductase [Prolixibacteraceae bacterium]|nr:FAD-dependent oxidoreductase [Prolixibacteraceae bacterium]